MALGLVDGLSSTRRRRLESCQQANSEGPIPCVLNRPTTPRRRFVS